MACARHTRPLALAISRPGTDDGSVRLWEVRTGRCMHTWQLGEPVTCVAWCPSQQLSLVAGEDLGV